MAGRAMDEHDATPLLDDEARGAAGSAAVRASWGGWVAMGVWIAVLAAGFGMLAAYAQRPGAIEEPPAAQEAGVRIADAGHTLVMAVHPRCPCTRATVYELERLLKRSRGAIHCVVLVYEPSGESDAWGGDDPFGLSWRVPGCELVPDPGGRRAALLGCRTSGSVVLYDAGGSPVFWGGITTGRGHTGDNLGSDSILSIVRGEAPPRRETAVYGCDLRNPERPVPEAHPSCCSEPAS